ncbi:conjugative transfer signal peptidase TraF [Neisseriaceae bacterium ESL0693]|nr:conjugative transfer signal peptidase TraF [Neisseriaceae bacterium ESL0693]
MKKVMKYIIIGLIIVGVVVIGLGVAGGRINTTKSIPIGLYWTTSEPVKKGSYVIWCPPKTQIFDEAKNRGYIGAGFCTGGYGYMMKRILAAKNDVLTITDEGVQVNGVMLPFSKPIKTDFAGRLLPHYHVDNYKLGNYEVLLMSDVSSTSFDGRYFGPINLSQVKTVILPVITF